MKDILNYVEEKVAALDDHPLFDWLASEETPLKERLMILPTVATVAMGFRDVNKWVLRYPYATNDLERGINIHTFEDQTHSRLFLEDWRRLGLDRRLGWGASDTLWWLFQAEVNEVIRDKCLYFLSIAAADDGDPLLRFAHSEVGELCARELFFKHISAVAGRLEEQTGLTMLYFGAHHIEAEGEGAESYFESVVLDEARRERARELCDVMIGVFSDILDAIHGYVLKHVVTGTLPRPAALESTATVTDLAHGEVVHPLLKDRRDRHAAHPFYTWIRHRGDRVPAIKALQRFLPLWAIDVLGFADVGRNVFRYQSPSSELEHSVNDWVASLTTRAAGFVRDWKALDLDELLGWDAGDTLEFYYLSRTMDVHRRHRVAQIQLASGNPDPLPRLWLIAAIATATDALLEGTGVLAAEVEAAGDLRLDFLAGRCPVAAPEFSGLPLSPEQHEVVAGMIETVFDFMDRQLDLSLDVALSNELRIS